MAFTKSTVSTTNISDLPNKPLISPTALKAAFDKYGADDKPFVNSLIDELESITPGSSGAENMGSAPISGVTGTTVHAQLSDLKAQNVNTMFLTGDQTAAGIKTFSSSPLVPVPTLDGQASNKEYVDDENANDVHLTGNQTVAGIKTFSDSPVVPTPSSSGQAASKGYVDGVAAGFVLGTLSDNSITNAKLGTNIKVGSLAALTTTEKSSAVGAINEVDANADSAITALGGLKFRNTSGFLEYSTDGVVWNPVGGKLVQASYNVKLSWPTVRTTGVGAQELMKVAQFIPDFTGTVRISCEVIRVGASGTAYLLNANSQGSGTNHQSFAGSAVQPNLINLPLGTVLGSNSASFAKSGIFTNFTTSYEVRSADVSVFAGQPFILAIEDSSTVGDTVSIRNITASWDVLTATAQLT